MSFKALVTLALATGFAAAKPINTPQSLPGYTKRNAAIQKGNGGDGFNFIDGFNKFNDQQQVVQIQQENLQIVDNGVQKQVVQQVNEVLIVDQEENGFDKDMKNLFRKSNFKNKNDEAATVILVVQEIQIAIDDGRGNKFEQNVFAQSALVANRGARETETVMIFDSRTLIAQDMIGDGAGRDIGGGAGGFAGATAIGGNMPTKTNGVQLMDAKPTWTSVAEDPAATLGGIWQAELEDLQKADNDEADNELNKEIAAEEMAALKEADNAEDEENQDENQDQAAAEEELANAEEEEKAMAEEEEQAMADEQEQAMAEEEEKAMADEQEQAMAGEEEQAMAGEEEKAMAGEEEQAMAGEEKEQMAEEQQMGGEEAAAAQGGM